MDKSLYSKHISQQFNKELESLRSMLMEMGGLIESQVDNAVQALISGDSDLAYRLRPVEERINEIELVIDQECARILALRQPTASDLRMVIAIARATKDMERVGDEAYNIAKLAISMAEEGSSPRGYVEVKHIGNHVRSMLRQSLDAFTRFSSEEAFKVVNEDNLVDQEYRTAMRSLVTFMMEDPRAITKVLNVIWVLRALERVGDHASNIAEHVIYLVEGKDVRHLNSEELGRQMAQSRE